MSRFFVDSSSIGNSSITVTDKEDIRHILKVLRLGSGDEVDISDGVQWEYRAVIKEASQDQILFQICDKQSFSAEPELKITLFQGIPKSGKMESIIQKCVELGVNAIVPVFMDRTVVIEKAGFDKKLQRWQKISDEAVKQCRRGIIPQIADRIRFDEMPSLLKDYDLVLFPYENEKDCSIKEALRHMKQKPKTMALIIGPEGGFSSKEAEALAETKAISVTLGKTVLRTETAGMAALAMVMYELEL